FNLEGGFPKATFTARKYSTTLYDDSVAERQIPVIVETGGAIANQVPFINKTGAAANFDVTAYIYFDFVNRAGAAANIPLDGANIRFTNRAGDAANVSLT
ncbi:MAG: hypothetical protein M3Q33_06270, partial [Acidobacteriota bacterium]|nr:hypothetical protein [Acidobacteriota bacterium]